VIVGGGLWLVSELVVLLVIPQKKASEVLAARLQSSRYDSGQVCRNIEIRAARGNLNTND
jgi:hypothetical protein